jgi:hypothetical protein
VVPIPGREGRWKQIVAIELRSVLTVQAHKTVLAPQLTKGFALLSPSCRGLLTNDTE